MNAVLLVMLWQAPGNDLSIHDKRKHPPHNKQPFVNVIADDLNLDNVQQEKLKELARHHHSGMMKMESPGLRVLGSPNWGSM